MSASARNAPERKPPVYKTRIVLAYTLIAEPSATKTESGFSLFKKEKVAPFSSKERFHFNGLFGSR